MGRVWRRRGEAPGGAPRRRILHRSGLLTLLVGGAMVFSGCWGLVVGPDENGRKAVVIPERFTNQIVYTHCGGGTSQAAARCVLDAVWRLCSDYPLKNMSGAECFGLTWPSSRNVQHMQNALGWLTASPVLVCLVGYFGVGHTNTWGASPRGFACG